MPTEPEDRAALQARACLWIIDEIQLMGAALAATAQLEAFRRTLPRAA
jgi:hypothetical protein